MRLAPTFCLENTVGKKSGIEEWEINLQHEFYEPEKLNVGKYTAFKSNGAYVILHTDLSHPDRKWAIHIWHGLQTTEEDYAAAKDFAQILHGRLEKQPIFYRERQGRESKSFMKFYSAKDNKEGRPNRSIKKPSSPKSDRKRALHEKKAEEQWSKPVQDTGVDPVQEFIEQPCHKVEEVDLVQEVEQEPEPEVEPEVEQEVEQDALQETCSKPKNQLSAEALIENLVENFDQPAQIIKDIHKQVKTESKKEKRCRKVCSGLHVLNALIIVVTYVAVNQELIGDELIYHITSFAHLVKNAENTLKDMEIIEILPNELLPTTILDANYLQKYIPFMDKITISDKDIDYIFTVSSGLLLVNWFIHFFQQFCIKRPCRNIFVSGIIGTFKRVLLFVLFCSATFVVKTNQFSHIFPTHELELTVGMSILMSLLITAIN